MICCAVQGAVGWVVPLKWTTCLLSCSRTKKPYKTLKVTVGTAKKSIAESVQHGSEESSSMFAKVADDFGVYTSPQLIPLSHSQAGEVLLESAALPRGDSRGTFF